MTNTSWKDKPSNFPPLFHGIRWLYKSSPQPVWTGQISQPQKSFHPGINEVLIRRTWFSLWTAYCFILTWYYNEVGLSLGLWQWSRSGCMFFQPPLHLCNPISRHALLRDEWSYSSFETFIWNIKQTAKLTGQHAAGSMESLHFQFWVFITTSSARSRVQTASRHFSGDPVKPSYKCKVAAGSPHMCEPEEESRDQKFNISS